MAGQPIVIDVLAFICLSAADIAHCYLPAMQRRRTAEDELNMREVYTEGDLISVSPNSDAWSHCSGCVAISSVQMYTIILSKHVKGCQDRPHLAACTLASFLQCQLAYTAGRISQ